MKHTFSTEIYENEHGFKALKLSDYLLSRLQKLKIGSYQLILDDKKPTRSTQQLRLYWLFLSQIEEETGNDAVDLHEIFKRAFLKPKFVTYKGKEVKLPATTKTLNKAEMSEYMAKIERETGVPVPDPHDIGVMCSSPCPRCNTDKKEIEYPDEEPKDISF